MNYQFPVGLTLEETREVVQRFNKYTNEQFQTAGYIEAERGDHVIFNYLVSFPFSFPDPATAPTPELARDYAILRECRGLTFSATTGQVMNRKFAKFFNVNEKPETQAALIDWSKPHVILEKLDGSMITPLLLGNDVRWTTKMGLTDVAKPVEKFVKSRPEYDAFARQMIAENKTPIFEWCSRQQRIVLDYTKETLVLTTIRDNYTGVLTAYDEMCAIAQEANIPVVKALSRRVEDINAFIEEVRAMIDVEGFVVRFEDGLQVKLKCDWYCAIHKYMEYLHREKDVLSLIVHDEIDDVKGFLKDEDRDAVERFECDVKRGIASSVMRLDRIVEVGRVTSGNSKKHFVEQVFRDQTPKIDQAILFAIWDGQNAQEAVTYQLQRYIHKTAATQARVDTVRYLFGNINWSSYRDIQLEE